jgi:uncharacterized protein (TIGR01777 family)
MARIAITGSSGLIGSALRKRLEADGDEVVRVRRGEPSEASASWNPEAGWFREGALEGCDAVVHLAGESIAAGRWTEGRKRSVRASRVEGTRLLVGHLAGLKQKPRVLVAASGVGYYGSAGDQVLTEASPRGGGFLAELVEAWEREALAATDLGIRVVALRLGVVLAKEGGALARMALPFRLGFGGRVGSGRQWMPFVSLEDAVRAFRFSIDSDIEGPVNVTAPEPVTNAEFTKALGRALRRPTLVPVPPAALKLLFGGEMVEETLLASQRPAAGKLLAAGFVFEHPDVESAIAAALG